MRISPELTRAIEMKVQDLQVRVLLFKIIEAADPRIQYTDYDQLRDGTENAYDEGFREGQIKLANGLLDIVNLVLKKGL